MDGQGRGRPRHPWHPEGGQPALTWWAGAVGWPGPVGTGVLGGGSTGVKLMAGSGKGCCGSGGRAGGGTEPTDRPGCKEHTATLSSCHKDRHQAHTRHLQGPTSHSLRLPSCQGHSPRNRIQQKQDVMASTPPNQGMCQNFNSTEYHATKRFVGPWKILVMALIEGKIKMHTSLIYRA